MPKGINAMREIRSIDEVINAEKNERFAFLDGRIMATIVSDEEDNANEPASSSAAGPPVDVFNIVKESF